LYIISYRKQTAGILLQKITHACITQRRNGSLELLKTLHFCRNEELDEYLMNNSNWYRAMYYADKRLPGNGTEQRKLVLPPFLEMQHQHADRSIILSIAIQGTNLRIAQLHLVHQTRCTKPLFSGQEHSLQNIQPAKGPIKAQSFRIYGSAPN
jgi:hypothetical protein